MKKFNRTRPTRNIATPGNGFLSRQGRYKRLAGHLLGCILVLAALLPALPLTAQQQAYEAEAAVRANGAAAQACGSCSGGAQVGNLGGSTKGTLTQAVTVGEAGDYQLTLSYATADPRTIFIVVNDQAPVEVPCPASGGWTTVATTEIRLTLRQGANAIRFENPGGWAPNLDKFALSPSPRYTVSGRVRQEGQPLAGVTVRRANTPSRTCPAATITPSRPRRPARYSARPISGLRP
jgi:hypothetical protein